ncbi:5-oxoprolinase subunit PxpB [Bacillus sp. AFS017336]|uniref:5-oxoprolinase subunit PxpB n=1 Tax=Bacillus sp. AFS017336 TaxID=2033489 RepID=UPI000BF0157B|nr:5-oxoprolinase subunit PxpB [Bacillus sp. AFS017336]PEL07779.1 allophanate hydrolase [Bacillus sp. AFS017336]
MTKPKLTIFPVGCSGIVCYLGDSISNEINNLVHTFSGYLNSHIKTKISGVVPSYHSITIYYDSLNFSFSEIKNEIEFLFKNFNDSPQNKERTIYEVPVCFHSAFGTELQKVAEQNNLTTDHVIRLYLEEIYPIYMIGFIPGFPYLGGLNPALETPRLIKPKNVLKGSVGIAGNQTGIYPFESPGGWNIIGRTPIEVFSTKNNGSKNFKAGDMIKFFEITNEEFSQIEQMVEKDNYSIKKEVHYFDSN